jgi:hypothetical protein
MGTIAALPQEQEGLEGLSEKPITWVWFRIPGRKRPRGKAPEETPVPTVPSGYLRAISLFLEVSLPGSHGFCTWPLYTKIEASLKEIMRTCTSIHVQIGS